MKYLDVCSGISAPTCAWKPLGWEAVAFSEIEKAPSAVLAHHYPTVPNLGDMTRFEGWPDYAIDVLVGGTPCQSFSVAGLRRGLADPRGNLMLAYLAIADRYRPRWMVWENVPGVLSSNNGRDFGTFLGALGRLGYGFAYRVFDAQYFGLAQRRERVFVVGYLGDWRRAAEVLFERESLHGHPSPRRETGQGITCSPEGITGTVSSKWAKGTGGPSGDEHYNLIAPPLTRNPYGDHESREGLLIAHTLRGEGFDASEDGTGRGTPLVTAFSCKDYGADAGTLSPNLRAMNHDGSHANAGGQVAIAIPILEAGARTGVSTTDLRAGSGIGEAGDQMFTLQAGKQHAVATSTVRRLTPRECERLQGFPDDFTLAPYRGKTMADGPRYKMLGNSMAVPVLRKIGERIAMVDGLK